MTHRPDDPTPNGSDNPFYRSPLEVPQPDTRPSSPDTDQSVFSEPWMKAREASFRPNPEPPPELELTPAAADPENSVWDEPGLSLELSGSTPHDGVTWFRWFLDKKEHTSAVVSWMVTLAIAAASGISAVLGTLLFSTPDQGQMLMIIFFGPTTEEIMKIAVCVWVCERRPWLFQSAGRF